MLKKQSKMSTTGKKRQKYRKIVKNVEKIIKNRHKCPKKWKRLSKCGIT